MIIPVSKSGMRFLFGKQVVIGSHTNELSMVYTVCNDACTLREISIHSINRILFPSLSLTCKNFQYRESIEILSLENVSCFCSLTPSICGRIEAMLHLACGKRNFTKESLVLPGMLPMQEYLETFGAHSWSPTTALQCSPGSVNRLWAVGSMEGITTRFSCSWPWNGCWKRDLFRAENVTSNWVIKPSLGRSGQLILFILIPRLMKDFCLSLIPNRDIYTHPGRLRWNLQITHLERNMIFQTSMIMFHINLQECTSLNP